MRDITSIEAVLNYIIIPVYKPNLITITDYEILNTIIIDIDYAVIAHSGKSNVSR